MTATMIEVEVLLDMVGEILPSCDFYEDGRVLCQGEAAEWVLYREPCCERAASTPALACGTCKDARVMDMISLECHFCGRIWEHATDAYSMIERLTK